MSEKHTNIADAKICQGINLVTGETGARILAFVQALFLANKNVSKQLQKCPEGDFSFKEIRQWFETLPDAFIARYIVTRSLFVMREAHMLQREHGYPVRWFYLKADGSFYQADSMDYIRECEALDEEIRQAERYINLENGLKPRTEPKPTNQPRDEMRDYQAGPQTADKDAYFRRNDIYKLYVTLEMNGKQHAACVHIDASTIDAFKPIDRCDDPIIAALVGGKNEIQAMEVDKRRKQLAKAISTQVTDFLMNGLKSADTENGYPKQS